MQAVGMKHENPPKKTQTIKDRHQPGRKDFQVSELLSGKLT